MHRRTLLGIGSALAALPLLLPLLMIVRILAVGEEDAGLEGVAFAIAFVLYLVGLAALVTLIVLYAIDAFRNPRLGEGRQVAWLVLLILAGVVVVPVYWWRHVRTREADG